MAASSRELSSTEYTSPAHSARLLWADDVGLARAELRSLRRALAEAAPESPHRPLAERLMPASQWRNGPSTWAALMAYLGSRTHCCTTTGNPMPDSSPSHALVFQGSSWRSPCG